MSLISSGTTSSCRAPCIWPRPRSVTAASMNAQPVTPPGPLLNITSSGCKVGPWLAASVSPRDPCPHLSRAFCVPPHPHARLCHLFMAFQRVLHLPYFLPRVLSVLLPTPIPPLSCTPWLSSDRLFRAPSLRTKGGTPRRRDLGVGRATHGGDSGSQPRWGPRSGCSPGWSRSHSQKPRSGVTPPKRRGACHLQEPQ